VEKVRVTSGSQPFDLDAVFKAKSPGWTLSASNRHSVAVAFKALEINANRFVGHETGYHSNVDENREVVWRAVLGSWRTQIPGKSF